MKLGKDFKSLLVKMDNDFKEKANKQINSTQDLDRKVSKNREMGEEKSDTDGKVSKETQILKKI